MKRDLWIFLGAIVLLVAILVSRCAKSVMVKPTPTPTIASTPTSTLTPTPLPKYKDLITPPPKKKETQGDKNYKPYPKNEVIVDVN